MVKILSFNSVDHKKIENFNIDNIKNNINYLNNKDVVSLNGKDIDNCVTDSIFLYFYKNKIAVNDDEFKDIFKSYIQLLYKIKENNPGAYYRIEKLFLDNLKMEYIKIKEDASLSTVFLNDSIVDIIMPYDLDIKKLLDNYNEYFGLKKADKNILYSVFDEFLERRKYEFLEDSNKENYVMMSIDETPFLYYEQKRGLLSKFLSPGFILIRNKMNKVISARDEIFKIYMKMNDKYKLDIELDKALYVSDYSLLNDSTVNFLAIFDLDDFRKMQSKESRPEVEQRSPGSSMNWR